MEIEQIYAKDYRGYSKEVTYWTKAYYDVIQDENGFRLEWKEFDQYIQKSFVGTLFGEDLEAPIAFGAFIDQKLVGFIEGSIESWHNLFRICFFFIEEEYRHFGIGDALIHKLMDYATHHTSARAFVLDTESCNTHAIAFYKHHGFTMVGLNTMDYSNEDTEEKEVHLEFGKKIDRFTMQNFPEIARARVRKP